MTNKRAAQQDAEDGNLCKWAGGSWPRELRLFRAFVWFYCDSPITQISAVNISLFPQWRGAGHPPCLSDEPLPFVPSMAVTSLLGLSLTETQVQLKLLLTCFANCGLSLFSCTPPSCLAGEVQQPLCLPSTSPSAPHSNALQTSSCRPTGFLTVAKKPMPPASFSTAFWSHWLSLAFPTACAPSPGDLLWPPTCDHLSLLC